MVKVTPEEYYAALEEAGLEDERPKQSNTKRILRGLGRMASNTARKVITSQKIAVRNHQKAVNKRQGPIKKGMMMDKKLTIWNTPNAFRNKKEVGW